MKLAVSATRETAHRRLIETFALRTKSGEATLQVIRLVDGSRVEAAGQGALFCRDAAKGRAFLADLGHPCSGRGEPRAFAFSIVQSDSGLDRDGGAWREFKLELEHAGASCEGSLVVHASTAELSFGEGEGVFWEIARIALAEGVVPRDAAPAGTRVSVPEVLRGAEALRLVEGAGQLLGLNSKASVFAWEDLSKKPRRVVDLNRTLTGAGAVPGRLVACGAAHASGAWEIVTVDLATREVTTVVESNDEFPFLNAKTLLSPDGARLAVAWENELRVYEGRTLVGRVVHSGKVTPTVWSNGAVVLETPEGARRWVEGHAVLEPMDAACRHTSPDGRWALDAADDGSLRVTGAGGAERIFRPEHEVDRRALRALRFHAPRWLAGRALLLRSDRLVALELETLRGWVIIDGADTQLRASVGAQHLVVDVLGSGRPRWVELSFGS